MRRATWCKELTHWKRPWCWERLKVGAEGDDRGWDGWTIWPTRWTWVWASLGDGEGQGSPVYCRPWGHKESDTTEQLNNSSGALGTGQQSRCSAQRQAWLRRFQLCLPTHHSFSRCQRGLWNSLCFGLGGSCLNPSSQSAHTAGSTLASAWYQERSR